MFIFLIIIMPFVISFMMVVVYCALGIFSKDQEGRDFYLLKPDTKHFKNAESCMTMIKEHLKEIQKNVGN